MGHLNYPMCQDVGMRLAELSRTSGFPSATIKYYLRLGLLAPGTTESSTWASYDDTHVRRLALVRALTEVASLSLDDVRRVLDAVDDSSVALHESLGTAQWLLSPEPDTAPSAESLATVDALVDRQGWHLAEGGPLRARLAGQLDTLARLDFPVTDDLLDTYAASLRPLVELDVSRIPTEDRGRAVERVVVGTLLYEPVIASIRRMLAEVVSSETLDG
ncbi:MerR family transcriptional regulator [Nocardioides oleivorans]|uniref:MerR family transcriptional regulator n=2 Tax=Nocardioides oleivorans TaxID=273676 RepID=A0A4V1RLD1_9ACTN|nr:MerR family transcriptional regulator [Nocardioides oleivorans]